MNTSPTLLIRPATLADIPHIVHIHRDDDDPWSSARSCESWITRRLERGFYIQCAVLEHQVVGHGEWIVSEEAGEPILYLGLMQIDADHQRQGIGRAMIADGIAYAQALGCRALITIPDEMTRSQHFYQRCGFRRMTDIFSCTLYTQGYGGRPVAPIAHHVPDTILHHHPLTLGVSQACSRHMWEVLNAKPSVDKRQTPALCLPGGGWIQLSYYNGGDIALGLYWGKAALLDLAVKQLLNLAARQGLMGLRCVFYAKDYEAFIPHHPVRYAMVYRLEIPDENDA